MKLTDIKLRNFTVFENADFAVVPGINVFIGENATGKSHLLKAVYSLLNAARVTPAPNPDEVVKERLASVFLPAEKNVGRLVRAGADGPCVVAIKSDCGETHASLSTDGDVALTLHKWDPIPPSTYLPARDVLSMYERFVPLYESTELSFDRTYYDLCVALQRPNPRGPTKAPADELSAPLFALLGGTVELDGPRFYVDTGDGPHEAHLVAEGLRKVATLAHLVRNGSIEQGSVLLWDEPETNLNPRILAKLAVALRGLASRGVQIFLSTHDFLLSHKLSLAAEHPTSADPSVRFFSLHRDSTAEGVQVEPADSLAGIRHNSILDEYAAHYDEERALFHDEVEGGGAR